MSVTLAIADMFVMDNIQPLHNYDANDDDT